MSEASFIFILAPITSWHYNIYLFTSLFSSSLCRMQAYWSTGTLLYSLLYSSISNSISAYLFLNKYMLFIKQTNTTFMENIMVLYFKFTTLLWWFTGLSIVKLTVLLQFRDWIKCPSSTAFQSILSLMVWKLNSQYKRKTTNCLWAFDTKKRSKVAGKMKIYSIG